MLPRIETPTVQVDQLSLSRNTDHHRSGTLAIPLPELIPQGGNVEEHYTDLIAATAYSTMLMVKSWLRPVDAPTQP
jgi:hypothetical protein